MAEEGPEPRIDSKALEAQWGVAFHFAPAPLTHHSLTLMETPRFLLCPTWHLGKKPRQITSTAQGFLSPYGEGDDRG